MKYRLKTLLLILAITNTLGAEVPIAASFSNGERTKFSTLNHPKAKGLNLAIHYPNSWKAKESGEGDIVQKFVNPAGTVSVDLQISKFPTKFTEAEIKRVLTEDFLKDTPPDGATLIHCSVTSTIGSHPMGHVEYSPQRGDGRLELERRVVLYYVMVDDAVVRVNCRMTLPDSKALQKELMVEYKPLFTLMATGITFPDVKK